MNCAADQINKIKRTRKQIVIWNLNESNEWRHTVFSVTHSQTCRERFVKIPEQKTTSEDIVSIVRWRLKKAAKWAGVSDIQTTLPPRIRAGKNKTTKSKRFGELSERLVC